jgi:hypothetical protein
MNVISNTLHYVSMSLRTFGEAYAMSPVCEGVRFQDSVGDHAVH